jgi:hypothetical protein
VTGHQLPGPAAVTVPAGQVKTPLAALDQAADYQRDRAAMCADCTDQSCATCQWRLQAADAYDQIAAQIIQAGEFSATRQCAAGRTAAASGGPHPAADPEAAQ